jgi:DNA modification methylase
MGEEFVNKLICGDAVEVMQSFLNDYIDLTVTSPPY